MAHPLRILTAAGAAIAAITLGAALGDMAAGLCWPLLVMRALAGRR